MTTPQIIPQQAIVRATEHCPNCDSAAVLEALETSTFEYGCPRSVPITVTEPVLRCGDCKQAWTDYRAEQARQEAIDRYRLILSLPVTQALTEALRYIPAWEAVSVWNLKRRNPYTDTAYELIGQILKGASERAKESRILQLATEVLSDKTTAWLSNPCSELNGESPVEALRYRPDRVEQVLRDMRKD